MDRGKIKKININFKYKCTYIKTIHSIIFFKYCEFSHIQIFYVIGFELSVCPTDPSVFKYYWFHMWSPTMCPRQRISLTNYPYSLHGHRTNEWTKLFIRRKKVCIESFVIIKKKIIKLIIEFAINCIPMYCTYI